MTNQELVSKIKEIIGFDYVLTGSDLDQRYEHIWSMDKPLQAIAVILPGSTLELSEILKLCYRIGQTVVVHGGLTNLVGSTKSTQSDLVISMERFNEIEEIDQASRTVTVQAGVILENVHRAVEEFDLLFPLNFGAKGSAQIGGILSTNAGGLRVFKYGMTRQLVLGLEAVKADGKIVSSMKKIIKDNSAYDIKQLFIGSEGTLGIITKAILKLIEKPRSRNSALVGISEYRRVVDFLKYMDGGLAGNLSGFELMWPNYYHGATSPPSQYGPPLLGKYVFYVLIESLGSDQEQDKAKLGKLLEGALEAELIKDAVMAHSESDLNWFWTIREDVHVIKSKVTIDHHFDVSLPIPLIGDYVEKTSQELMKLDGVEQVYQFGHIADGNIHFIVGKVDHSAELRESINQIVYGPLKDIGGSVSAEHGIGEDKKAYLSMCRSKEEIELMRSIKRSLDPKNILNRGKVFDLD